MINPRGEFFNYLHRHRDNQQEYYVLNTEDTEYTVQRAKMDERGQYISPGWNVVQ